MTTMGSYNSLLSQHSSLGNPDPLSTRELLPVQLLPVHFALLHGLVTFTRSLKPMTESCAPGCTMIATTTTITATRNKQRRNRADGSVISNSKGALQHQLDVRHTYSLARLCVCESVSCRNSCCDVPSQINETTDFKPESICKETIGPQSMPTAEAYLIQQCLECVLLLCVA